MKTSAILAGLALTAAILSARAAEGPDFDAPTSPEAAIHAAAAAAPAPVPGQFAMRVQASGRQDGNLYLNSELDYRDQRCLTIAIFPSAMEELIKRYGQAPDTFFIGKNILVHSAAVRTKIVFFADGKPTDKYYYQTQVPVFSARQIEVLEMP